MELVGMLRQYQRSVESECLAMELAIPALFTEVRPFIFSEIPVGNARLNRFSQPINASKIRRCAGDCALHGHFCKIDRIGASTRRLLHVIGTNSFI